MKRIITIAIAVCMLISCTPTSKTAFTITGELAGLEDNTTLYIVRSTSAEGFEATVQNGKFAFSGDVEVPEDATLTDKNGFRWLFVLEPGKIKFTGDASAPRVNVTGTPSNVCYSDFNNAIIDYMKRLIAASDDQRAAMQGEYMSIAKKAYENNNNYGGFLAFQELIYGMEPSEVVTRLEAFPEEVQASDTWISLYDIYSTKVRVLSAPYIDFEQGSLEDNSKMISLKSIVEKPGNKYVLLDFWATWCGPCMRDVPYLVDTYNEFHDKGFEIFGSSLDSDYQTWKDCVQKNNMSWIQVSDLSHWNNSGAKKYSVNAVPANFLINCADGSIIDAGISGAELKSKIAKLFAE